MNLKSYNIKNFEKEFLEEEDFNNLIELLNPFKDYFPFKNRRHDSWHRIFKKISKILIKIYKDRFENNFQCAPYTEDERTLLILLFKFLQRVQMFSNNTIDLPDKNLYLPYALSFDEDVSISSFKVISLFYYKDKILKNNPQLIEVLLKLVNIPGLKVRKSLYDKSYSISSTNSPDCDDPLEYFNSNKKTKNITDLYIEAHQKMGGGNWSLIIKTYALITLGSPVDSLEEILENLKKTVANNALDFFIADETKYLLDEFVFYLLRNDFDQEIIKRVLQSDGFLEKRLKYDNESNFEHISIYSNISEIKFDIKYDLTSTVNNPDIDFQYFSGIYSLIKRENDVFISCLDLEKFKVLLDKFDILHSGKDPLVLKIIFKIMNEVYKKSSAYFEPFEDSQYLKKCVTLVKDQSVEFAYLCVKTITFFMNHDPLSIANMVKSNVLDIFHKFKCSESMNVALTNLFDAVSLDKGLRTKFVQDKVLTQILDEMLLVQDSFFSDFSIHFSKLIKHHPEYYEESFNYLYSRLEKNPTTAFFNFIASQDVDRSDYVGWIEDDMIKSLDRIIEGHYKQGQDWKEAFYKFFHSGHITIFEYDRFISYFADRFDVSFRNGNLSLAEFYLNLECNVIFNRKDRYDGEDEEDMPEVEKIFDILLKVLPKVLTELKDDEGIPDILDLKDFNLINENVYSTLWLEINYIFDYIWNTEGLYEEGDTLTHFLNCIFTKPRDSPKRVKLDITERPLIEFDLRQKQFLKGILQKVLPKFQYYILRNFFTWIMTNDILENESVWSKKEISDIFCTLDVYFLNLPHDDLIRILKFYINYDADSKILKFIDGIIDEYCIKEVNGVSYTDYELIDLVTKIYLKYYKKDNLIKNKIILHNVDFIKKFTEEGSFRIFLESSLICKKLAEGDFIENNEYVILCINTLKNYTFIERDNLEIDHNRLRLIMKSKIIKRKYKMLYILSYLKYMKSRESHQAIEENHQVNEGNNQELHDLKRILKFALKSISLKNKKNTNFLIKCIIHNIFDHSRELLDFKSATTPARFLSSNYLVGYQNINYLKRHFEKIINNTNDVIIRFKLTKIHKGLFKSIMKKAFENILILNVLTEILVNNNKYIKFINKEFIMKILDNFISPVNLSFKISTDEDYYIALKFLVFCLRSKNTKLVEITQKLIIEQMCLARNHKIYNYLAILYSSMGIFYIVKSDYEKDTHEEDSSYSLSEFYMKNGIADNIFRILSQVKESDLRIINLINNEVVTDDQIMLYAWNSINDTNKICFIYSFLSYLYDRQYDYLLDMHEMDESDYEDDDDDYDFEEMHVPENVTPECSSENEEFEIIEEAEKIKKSKIFNSIYSAYFLCQKECEIMEKKKTAKFLESISKVFKKEFVIENMYKEFNKEEDLLDSHTYKDGCQCCSSSYIEDESEDYDESDPCYYSDDESSDLESEEPFENDIFGADLSVSDESSIGEENGIKPDISIRELNEMSEEALDIFIKGWYTERKANSSSYLPIDKEFVNSLNELARPKFEESESKLKDDYFVYAPDYESSKEFDISEKEDINLYIGSALFTDFLMSYISEDYTLQNEFSDFAEIMNFNAKLRKITLDIISEKIYNPSFVKKCLQISKAMLTAGKQDIESALDFVKQIVVVSKFQDFHEDALFILSKLKVDANFTDVLVDLSEISNLSLTLKSQVHLKAFCSNNLKDQILDFLCILLDNPIRNLNLIIDLSYQCHKNISEKIRVKKKIYKMDFMTLYNSGSFRRMSLNTNTNNDLINDININLTDRNDIDLVDTNNLTDSKDLLDSKDLIDTNNINLTDINNTNPLDNTNIKDNIFNKLDKAVDTVTIDYPNLTIFGLYEEFINWLSITNPNMDIIERYYQRRLQLERLINENQDIINNFIKTNDIIIPFLSKFNVVNFTNKEKYLRSKMDYYKDGSFVMNVRRKTILEDSFFQIMRKSSKELKAKRIQIKFSGEQGLDFGGLTKEWLELIMKEALNPDKGLFVYSSEKRNTMHPFLNSKINSDHLLYFRFIGRVLAKVIIEGYNIGIHFDKSVYKYLIGVKCVLEDLEEIDPQYYKSLIWIRDNPIESVLHLSFSVENTDLGFLEVIDLIPNGQNILVTDQNKNEYINLIVENKLIRSIESQLKAIKKGMYEMIDEDIISIFNEKEVELLICGIPDINVEDWQNNTEYHGYTKNSRNIIWFWKAVEGFTPDEKAKLLQFCTSSSRVPFEGFKNLQSTNGLQKFSIHKISTIRLPTAHTCFNQLDLPEYSNYEELRKNIIYAIYECQGGFGII